MSRVPASITVAVDFGDASARAVAVAGCIAARCGAGTLRLLHADAGEAPPYITSEQLDALKRQWHDADAQTAHALSRFAREHTSTPFVVAIERRAPVEAILAAAADLVVMGTHGRHGPKRWWLGSVAEQVLRATDRPLLIVRATESAAAPPPEQLFDRVIVHASAPIAGDAALALARRLTECFGGVVADVRHGLIEPELERHRATLLVAAVPQPRSAAWTSNYGEPLVRFCGVPILFVPENVKGAQP
jgi:nucleotide-binding universal stress UspA family protein